MDTSGFSAIESMLSSHTPDAEAAVSAFSVYFASNSLSYQNSHIFQKILKYNYPPAVDAVLKRRDPETFFSILKPSREQLVFAFSTLSEYRVGELYEPVILVCLGILQNAYKNPQYGESIYHLSVADIYHTAKYFKIENEKIESILINFLDSLNLLSGHKDILNLARNIMNAHYDNSKKIENILPPSILL